HDLCIIDAVTSEQRHLVLSEDFESPSHDFREYREVDAALWKAGNGHRGYGCSCHRPYVVDRVERCDAAVIERVIDYRSKKVERLNDREVIAETIHARIVGKVEADNQIRVVWLFRSLAHHLSEGSRRKLSC